MSARSRAARSTATLTFLGDLLRGHLKKIRSRWRKLTVRRWVLEVSELLAAQARHLERALKKGIRTGGHIVLIEGTLIRTRRRTGADNRRNYSGKHKAPGA
ncbi:hypothetical protein [Streptomyces lydicus]|uniref:hypothetical protein n=1 Tax=Streptomyces lydicus TaxID=47763 RepID=UPI00378D1611